jgi:hypothetical protein
MTEHQPGKLSCARSTQTGQGRSLRPRLRLLDEERGIEREHGPALSLRQSKATASSVSTDSDTEKAEAHTGRNWSEGLRRARFCIAWRERARSEAHARARWAGRLEVASGTQHGLPIGLRRSARSGAAGNMAATGRSRAGLLTGISTRTWGTRLGNILLFWRPPTPKRWPEYCSFPGFFSTGRCWARTSDLLLVRQAL